MDLELLDISYYQAFIIAQSEIVGKATALKVQKYEYNF
jgi:hypothetical protein